MTFSNITLAFQRCFCFLIVLASASFSFASEITLQIGRNDLLNPGSKKELWLHIISNHKDIVRGLTFRNGSATAIYLVSSSGLSLKRSRLSSPRRGQDDSIKRPFSILPGDTSGTIVGLRTFETASAGLHYMIFAIPNPLKKGVLFSNPCQLSIQDGEFEAVVSIPFSRLPNPVKNTFQREFETFLSEEGFPQNSIRLPF